MYIPPSGREVYSPGASAPPPGNTGGSVIDGEHEGFSCGIDALSLTFFCFSDSCFDQAANTSRLSACVRFIFDLLPVGLALGDERQGGRGYRVQRQIFQGEKVVGSFKYLGNRDSISLELVGGVCAQLDLDQLELYCSAIPAWRITRADFAFDDFGSQFKNYGDWFRFATDKCGFQPVKGPSPRLREQNDFGSGHGSTLYIGSPNSCKLIRIYEKGLQLQLTDFSAWVRVELQLRSGDFDLNFDQLRRPGEVLKGMAGLHDLPIPGAPVGAKRVAKLVQQASVEKSIAWLQRVAGPSLRPFLGELEPGELESLLSNFKPSALNKRGLSDAQAQQKIREHFDFREEEQGRHEGAVHDVEIARDYATPIDKYLYRNKGVEKL